MEWAQAFWRDVTALGGSLFFSLLTVLALLLQEMDLFWQLLFGLLFPLLCIVPIRLLYFKKRPRPQKYRNILEKIDAASFPSLHAARFVFLALVLIFFFWDLYVIILLVIVTALVAYSRMYLQKHDWKDVLGGVVVGIVTFVLSTLF